MENTYSVSNADMDLAAQETDITASASAAFIGGGVTYSVGSVPVITGFDPVRDVLDLGGDSIHNQIPVDTQDGFMMLHMFNPSKSTLIEGVWLADLFPESFAPISDSHLQQDMSAALAWEDGSGLVRENTVYIRSHEEGVAEIVDFDPATDKISFFYLSVRGDGELNFSVEQTEAGVRFYNPLNGQSMTLRDITFDDLDSSHFEWRANQLEDNVASRMNLSSQIENFQIVSENVFSGKSVAMAGLVDRAPYHSQPEYTGTPISGDPIDYPDDDTGGGDVGDPNGSDDITPGTVTPVIQSEWSDGFVAQVTFSPDEAITGWMLQVRMSAEITNIWNAEILSREDDVYTLGNVGYNGNLPAGGEASFGFQAAGSDARLTFLEPGDGDDTGGGDPDPIMVTVFGGAVTEADPGMTHVHDDGTSHIHDDGHRYITFTVALDEAATEEITITYTTEDGTAVADTTSDIAWDYHTATGTLVFEPGQLSQTVLVAVHPDELIEETETFIFRVAGDNIAGMLEATGTIYDDDVAPTREGTEGNDTLTGDGEDDYIVGLGGNDVLRGAAGDDTIEGGDGADKLNGGADDDQLDGGMGNDALRGGAGADTLAGGMGNDILFGGTDADVFVFTENGGLDRIKDFDASADIIDLRAFGGVGYSLENLPNGTGLIVNGERIAVVERFTVDALTEDIFLL